MPPKKAAPAAAAAAAAAAPRSPAPQPKRLSNASTAPSTPAAAAAASSPSVPSFVFRSSLAPGDVNSDNALFFMLRAIYQYLQQFGFQSVAEELHAQCQERYPDDQPLSLQDTQEGPLHETAVVALDSLHLLVTLSCISNSAASESFEAAVRLKAAACLSALREGGPKLFAECLDQFFPSAEAPEVEGGNPRCCSAATADSVDKRKAQGAKLFSDAELRGYRLFTTRRQLLMYAEAKSQLATLRAKAPLAAVLRKQLEDVDSEYSRENVQEKCYNTIRLIMSALKCNGPAVLETIAKAIENRDWKALTVRSSDKDKPEEDEEEEDAADDFADAADAMEDEVNGYDASPVVADPFVAAADEEVQEEEEQEEEEPEPAPVPVKRRPGRPTKAEVAARAAAAAAPATPKIRAPLSLTPAPVPEVARTLQAASDKLKSATKAGRDPLAEALKVTQNLSKAAAPAAGASSAAAGAEEDADEEVAEDVEVAEEAEEEEEEAPATAAAAAASAAKKRGGRPTKASKKQSEYESKYDREDKNAVKISFTEDEAEEEEGKEAASAAEGADDEPMLLPSFTSKKRVLDKGALDAAAAAAPSPKPASKLSQLMDASQSQRSRPIPHRHKEDRSVRRVPWSTEEIQKLTDGVVEFAAEHKKWAMILNKYGEFFQDRTVVDLKDKWRNLKSKLGAVTKGKGKGSKRKADDEGEVEEIEE